MSIRQGTRKKRTQGLRAGLDRAMVAQATLDAINHGGIDALSVRAVSKRLGVEAMSLYNHYPSKRALLEGAFDALIAQIKLPNESAADAKSALFEIAKRTRAIAHKNYKAIPLFALVCPGSPTVQKFLDRICYFTARLSPDLNQAAVAKLFLMQNHFMMGALMSDYVAIETREKGTDVDYLPVPCANLERLKPYLSKPGAADKYFNQGFQLLLEQTLKSI
jgi:AcrR family transcriptional regulator